MIDITGKHCLIDELVDYVPREVLEEDWSDDDLMQKAADMLISLKHQIRQLDYDLNGPDTSW